MRIEQIEAERLESEMDSMGRKWESWARCMNDRIRESGERVDMAARVSVVALVITVVHILFEIVL